MDRVFTPCTEHDGEYVEKKNVVILLLCFCAIMGKKEMLGPTFTRLVLVWKLKNLNMLTLSSLSRYCGVDLLDGFNDFVKVKPKKKIIRGEGF